MDNRGNNNGKREGKNKKGCFKALAKGEKMRRKVIHLFNIV